MVGVQLLSCKPERATAVGFVDLSVSGSERLRFMELLLLCIVQEVLSMCDEPLPAQEPRDMHGKRQRYVPPMG
jgi:hypothetical protein